MPWNIVKQNKAKCLHCGDILISDDDNPVDSCSCGKLTISGQNSYLIRTGSVEKDYEELSELDFDESLLSQKITDNKPKNKN